MPKAATYLILAAVLIAGMVWSFRARKLTAAGALAGGLTGFFVFMGAGFTGLLMMTVFFLMGTMATSWKQAVKEGQGLAESREGRTAGQVLANAGVGGLLGIAATLMPRHTGLVAVMMAAAFASAAADTVSSELGNVYGSRYYNIISFKKDARGLNGVISLEGTLFGLAASFGIAFIHAIGFGLNGSLLCIVTAGTLGNLSDSVLGATLERSRQLNNDAVNFFNTLLAALAAWGMHQLIR